MRFKMGVPGRYNTQKVSRQEGEGRGPAPLPHVKAEEAEEDGAGWEVLVRGKV